MEPVGDNQATEAFGQIVAGLDALLATGLAPRGRNDAEAWIRSLEHVGRRVDTARVELLAEIHDAGWHRHDGHASGRAMIEVVADLSVRESGDRERVRKIVVEFPEVAQAFREGRMTAQHLGVLGRLRGKRAVRFAMWDRQTWFVEQAGTRRFADFERTVLTWARVVDSAHNSNQQAHETRCFRMRQDPVEGSWTLTGSCGAGQGAMVEQILRAYAEAELEADREKVRAEHGEGAVVPLPRSAAQRALDALTQIFLDAVGSPGSAAANVVHNIVWSREAFDTALAAIECNRTPEFDLDTYRCETIDGLPVDPIEAAVQSLVHAARRVVLDASGTVIDLGRARFFTGHARIAALLHSTRCIWPGCRVPSSSCQVDHLVEHRHGGRTCPGNGAPLCGRHNRHKTNHGFTVQADPTRPGTYQVTRSNGTLVA
jgi:hypothetical protein